jgi:hypothetical protein
VADADHQPCRTRPPVRHRARAGLGWAASQAAAALVGPSSRARSCAAPWSASKSNACLPTPDPRRCCGCGGKDPAFRTWRCCGAPTCAASTWK